jgi:hypothetical protein
MNFKRLLNSGIEASLTNDLRFWIGNQLIKHDKDYNKTVSLIAHEFRTLGELHHSISAQLEAFPKFRLIHLSRVLSSITKTFTTEEAE